VLSPCHCRRLRCKRGQRFPCGAVCAIRVAFATQDARVMPLEQWGCPPPRTRKHDRVRARPGLPIRSSCKAGVTDLSIVHSNVRVQRPRPSWTPTAGNASLHSKRGLWRQVLRRPRRPQGASRDEPSSPSSLPLCSYRAGRRSHPSVSPFRVIPSTPSNASAARLSRANPAGSNNRCRERACVCRSSTSGARGERSTATTTAACSARCSTGPRISFRARRISRLGRPRTTRSW